MTELNAALDASRVHWNLHSLNYVFACLVYCRLHVEGMFSVFLM